MILYFANRMMEILGTASTETKSRFTVIDDTKTEDSSTGIGTFECTIAFNDDTRAELETMLAVGNHILRAVDTETNGFTIDGSHDFFTIVETEVDVANKTIYAYAEDAGLDLINDLAPAGSYSTAVDIETYIDDFAGASGFTVRNNEIPNETRKLSWDTETTVAERLQSIADSFDCDLSFGFEIGGLTLTGKYIDVTNSDGAETDVILYMNKDVSNITVKESINNLATALYATGKDDLTLSGYKHDDGDYYVNGKYLFSRMALQNWQRLQLNSNNNGDIYRTYSCDATTQVSLCESAIEQLATLREPEINYEVEIRHLSTPVEIRDRISVVDDKGELYLSAKVLQLETSVTAGTVKATLGDYIMQDDGISEQVLALVNSFSDMAKNRYIWIAYADDAKGTGISTDPTGKSYLGVCVNQLTEDVDISDPSLFTWSKIEGSGGGTGVESVKFEYYLSESETETTGGTWAESMPTWESGKYIWQKTVVDYDDGTTTETTPILAVAINTANQNATDAQSAAETANTAAQTATKTATAAVETANVAQETASTAQVTAETAKTTAETAQSEVKEINQHFWYDSDGAHVQGDKENPTYRTDIKDVGMAIMDISGEKEESVATFGVDGVQIGKSENAHQNIDYHSWKITDKEGAVFAEIKDLRDENGIATVEDVFFGDGKTTCFRTVLLPIQQILSVKIDGKETTDYTEYKLTDNIYGINLNTVITYKNKLTIKYTTKDTAAKAYTLGKRDVDGSSGGYSTVEGYNNIAAGYCSHVEGQENIASGNWSHAEGYMTEASGAYSHAEGFRGLGGIVYKTKATGHASHAEGHATEANGFGAHSEGHGAIADGDYSHAEGEFTNATGEASHASGYGTTAGYDHQLVCGTYNQNKADSLFEVGNGESIDGDEIYSNAFRVDKDGNIYARNSTVPIGTVYSASKSTAITTAGIDNYVYGASVTVPAGTYVIVGQWTYNTASSTGSRNLGIAIKDGSGTTLVHNRLFVATRNYASQNIADIETVTEETTFTVCGASSKTCTATTNRIKAVKIC